jgi:hypothetical protein
MDQHLTTEQVLALAPDTSSAKAARSLAAPRNWVSTGRNGQAAWGECQGSAKDPYRTQIDLSEPAFRCSCPSRKFPCKHGLGLLLLMAEKPGHVTEQPPPAWVSEWLATRAGKAEKRAERKEQAEKAEKTEDDGAAQRKRTAAREGKVAAGMAELDRWLRDQVRAGLADLQSRSPGAFDTLAARMIDAQAPGIARLLREAGGIATSGDGWQGLLLDRLARLHLLVQAYGRLEALAPATQADVRTAIGFTQNQDELMATGHIRDQWVVIGQHLEEEGHLTTQRTWLWGMQQGRPAVSLSFSAAGQPLDRSLVVGATLDAELVFYPGAAPLRALVDTRHASSNAAPALPDGTLTDGLARYAAALAANPWTERYPLLIASASLARENERWLVCDGDGRALPLSPHIGDPWRLLATTANKPATMIGEWNGLSITPLSLLVEQRLIPIGGQR